jgi:hypothetical protein
MSRGKGGNERRILARNDYRSARSLANGSGLGLVIVAPGMMRSITTGVAMMVVACAMMSVSGRCHLGGGRQARHVESHARLQAIHLRRAEDMSRFHP